MHAQMRSSAVLRWQTEERSLAGTSEELRILMPPPSPLPRRPVASPVLYRGFLSHSALLVLCLHSVVLKTRDKKCPCTASRNNDTFSLPLFFAILLPCFVFLDLLVVPSLCEWIMCRAFPVRIPCSNAHTRRCSCVGFCYWHGAD